MCNNRIILSKKYLSKVAVNKAISIFVKSSVVIPIYVLVKIVYITGSIASIFFQKNELISSEIFTDIKTDNIEFRIK